MKEFVRSLWDDCKHAGPAMQGQMLFRHQSSADNKHLYKVGYGLLDVPSAEDDPSDNSYLLVFSTEVGERAQLIRELTQAKEEAERSSQIKSNFLANVSHELRTPITSILGFSQLIVTQDNLDPEVADFSSIIMRNSENLLALVQDVLDLAKAEFDNLSLRERYINLSTLVYEEVQAYQTQAKTKNLQFNTYIALSVPQKIYIDDNKVRHILRTLLSNGLKFTDEGTVNLFVWSSHLLNWESSVPAFPTLSAQAIEDKKAKAATFLPPRDKTMLHFEICDTGIGITEETLKTIFEPFQRSRSGVASEVGTGLGLAVSKRFATFLGGDIVISSQKGQGTCCHFYLPVRLVAPLEDADLR